LKRVRNEKNIDRSKRVHVRRCDTADEETARSIYRSVQRAFTCVQLVHSGGYDDHQRQQFGVREYVLHARRPLNVPTVDERQQHWKERKQ